MSLYSRYKYVLAYLPVVAFYYRGRALMKLKLSSTFEELRNLIVNVTGETASYVSSRQVYLVVVALNSPP